MADIREEILGGVDWRDMSLLGILNELEALKQKYGCEALDTVCLDIEEEFIPYGNGDSVHKLILI